MRAFFAIFVILAVINAASLPQAAAEEQIRNFLIPADAGYGMDDCLGEGGLCGKIVADSWCQANGLKMSLHVEAIDATDITGSLSTPTSQPTAKAPAYIVSCSQ